MQNLNEIRDEDRHLEMEKRITRALQRSGRDALVRHKREGQPIVIWRDGKVVKVPAEEIVIPPMEQG